MQLTNNFNLDEFRFKDGAEFPDDVIINLQFLALNLQVLRDEIQSPIKINSGYRSPEHNKKIGGAKHSYHVRGMAADIQSDQYTPKELFNIIERLIQENKMTEGGLKAYSNFLHYDFRGTKSRW